MVDCCVGEKCHGCQGGWPLDALNWAKTNAGMCAWAEQPYKGKQVACNNKCNKLATKITGGHMFAGEQNMATEGEKAPLVVGVDVLNWQFFAGGLYTGGCGMQPQHAVTIVGLGSFQGNNAWLIKNSWGEGWGRNGFMMMLAGRNLCNVGGFPSAVN